MVVVVSGVASDPQNPKTTTAASQDENSRRPPLLLEKDHININGDPNNNNQRKSKSPVVSSRYMSPSNSSTSTSNSSTSTSNSSSSSSSSSISASRRFLSPSISRNSSNHPSVDHKRSVSVDRRRPESSPAAARPLLPGVNSKNGNATGISAATKLLVTSTRCLSVSFQGEAFSLPISKTKAVPPSPNLRKGTPQRRRSNAPSRGDHVEYSKAPDQNHQQQHRWPARNRSFTSIAISKSLDCSGLVVRDSKSKLIQGLQQSVIIDKKRPKLVVNELSVPCNLIPSDSNSVSLDSTSGVQECALNGSRGPAVSARLWQETNSQLRRLQDLGSSPSKNPNSKLVVPLKSKRHSSDSPLSSPRTISSPGRGIISPASPGKLMVSSPLPSPSSKLVVPLKSKRHSSDSPLSSPRTISSPGRGATSPASPGNLMVSSPLPSPSSKLVVPLKSKRHSSNSPLSSPLTISSPGQGAMSPTSPGKLVVPSPLWAHSPSRIRNAMSTICNNFLEMPSVLSFTVDFRRGKVGENRIVDVHMLRLMYNRQLQWRFVNARTEAVLIVQRCSAEKILWNAWIAISDLRDTVTKKRHRLQLLRRKLKLASILRRQMALFEDWASLEKDHSVSLVGAIEALKATTIRLPVVGRAIANVQSLKEATGSAVDVMQAMASSIYSLLPIIEEVNSLVTELAKVTAKERALLKQCTDFISWLASMQVADSSLTTHRIQQRNCVPSSP